MKLQNPNGLWLLLGIPVVLIIFFIRLHHENTSVSSTYIWRLSERFLKKKAPLSRMKGILSLILQILIITSASLLVSMPAVYSGNATEHIVVLDTSASMMTVNEKGVSRFDRAKKEILRLAMRVNVGHSVTLITGADDPIRLIDKCTDYGEIRRVLDNIECGIGDVTDHKIESAVQALVSESYYSETYFYTDTDYRELDGIRVINVSDGEWNVAITSLTTKTDGNGRIFSATLKSVNGGGELDLTLSVDGNDVESTRLSISDGEELTVDLQVKDLSDFERASVRISADDALKLDNEYSLPSRELTKRNVLLISKSALYVKYALNALGDCSVTHFMSLYGVELSGYDLYIFDHAYPEKYPTDGAVFQMGTRVLPDGVSLLHTSDSSAYLRLNTSAAHVLHKDLRHRLASVKNYGVLSSDSSWSCVLTCNTHPVLLTKKLDSGHVFSVLSFDLHDSNLPLMLDFPILMRNLVDYSVPGMLDSLDVSRGDGALNVRVLPYCEEITVITPDGEQPEHLPEGDTVSFLPDKVGIYTVRQRSGDRIRTAEFFLHVSEEESLGREGGRITIEKGEEPTDTAANAERAVFDVSAYAASLLLLLLLAEWRIYYHDKY